MLGHGEDALELVVNKTNKYNGNVNGNGKAGKRIFPPARSSRQRLPDDGDMISPKNGCSRWIYQTYRAEWER